MNPEQLKAYKREKSRLFNANLRDLRLKDKEKKRTADQQPDNQGNLQGNQDNLQDNQEDELTLQDLADIFETLDTKLDIIQNKLETIIETKLETIIDTKLDLIESNFETIIDTKLDIIETKLETIIENKLYEPLEKNQPIKQQPSIFFA